MPFLVQQAFPSSLSSARLVIWHRHALDISAFVEECISMHCVAIKYIWHRTIPSSASSPVGRFLCFCRHLKGKLQAQGPEVGSEVGHISQSLISFPQPSASFNHSLKPGDPKDLRNLFANNSFVHIFPYC